MVEHNTIRYDHTFTPILPTAEKTSRETAAERLRRQAKEHLKRTRKKG